MSGFAAIVRLDGAPVADEAGATLIAALRHRGPDAAGAARDGAVLLTHVLFRTTPEAQAFADRPGFAMLAGDLRVDNRDTLIRELALDFVAGDAEVVLAAYERWGEDCVERLEGDFAFALWDRRRRRLFCARDPLGVKPLVTCLVPGRLFACASEVAALLALDEVPRDLDAQRIADFLAVHFDDTERTFHRSIRRLPGGHALALEAGRVRTTRTWHPDRVPPLRLASDEAYAEGYRDAFTRAVRARMRVNDPSELGSMLSGGLDSTSIACLARDERARRGEGPLHVYSWIFSDALDADERRYQELAVATGGFFPHTLDSATAGFGPWSGIEDLLPGGPPYAPNNYLNGGAAEIARGHGVKVLLDGTGGDSTVSPGRARLTELVVRGRPLTLVRELRALARTSPVGASAGRIFLSHVARPLVPPRLMNVVDRARRRPGMLDGRLRFLRPELARLSGARRPRFRPSFSARQAHVADLGAPLFAEGLELLDRVYARRGIEGRYPFFDRRLIEFCVSLPAEQKLAGGFTRLVARRGMAGVLPPEIQWRTDKGKPGLHVIPALRASRARLDELFLHEPSVLADWVELDVLRAAYRDLLAGRADFLTVVSLWSAASLAAWLRAWV